MQLNCIRGEEATLVWGRGRIGLTIHCYRIETIMDS